MIKFKKSVMTLLICTVLSYGSTAFAAASHSQELQDARTTAFINEKIANDKSISFFHIVVATHKGYVSLTGTVNTAKDAYKIVEIVDSLNEVKDVDLAHLKIKKSHQPIKDMLTTLKVKTLLLRKNQVAFNKNCFKHIKVETYDSIVYLSGYTTNQDCIQKAIYIAENVKNVVAVKVNIRVNRR